MARLLIVSNRLPVTIEKKGGGLNFRHSAGGLATGLGAFYREYDSLWIGWPGIIRERIKEKERSIKAKLISDFGCYPVFLSQRDIERFYHGFSNKTLWPISHYFTQYANYNNDFWEAYKQVNELFSKAVIEIAKKDDIIWIHDYHLMLVPKLIRERLSEATIGFFHHIPFPSFEIFRLLPWRKEILEGLLGADLVGFHTYDYARHFLGSVHRLLGYEHTLDQISTDDRIVRVDPFPMGIDYERFSKANQESLVQKEIDRFRKKIGDSKTILSVDRLDYTKGIPQRLEVFNMFLERNPEYKEKVIFILVAVPSRTQVEHYRLLKKQMDELVGRINGKYGTMGWSPIWYLYRFLPFNTLAALYSIADICFVTPVRDGMNLIAKEYLATRNDMKGVLVLSEMAGAARELGEAIIVNPNNNEEMIKALEEALAMSEDEKIEHNKTMQKRIQRYTVYRWAEDFIDRLSHTKALQKELQAKILPPEIRRKLINDYRKAERRLLLLDYDGTLIPFSGKPGDTRPDDDLLKLLEKLSTNKKNEVVLISGRDKDTLERWFGNLNLGFASEHGAWIKDKKNKKWETLEPLTSDWKDKMRPILEQYTDRTPGSFIEEKDFSLVWHYRRSNPELSAMRAGELVDELVNFTANLGLQVLEGSKVVEIKNAGINKGRAALRWMEKEKWDFILAIGDDHTDEDVFEVLPERAYSIKVGLGPSLARFNLRSSGDVVSLLKELI